MVITKAQPLWSISAVTDAIPTEVYAKAPPRFNLGGQLLATQLIKTDDAISQGLAKRIVKYAERTLNDAGFLEAVTGWQVTVPTIDAEDIPSERSYNVQWENNDGGILEVVGILTHRGWPTMDRGLDIHR